MNLSVRDLQDLLQGNPDLGIVDDGVRFLEKSNNRIIERKIERMSEHDLQRYIIKECDRRALSNPLWNYIFAIPNGGYRDKATAGKLKAEGVRAGVLDLFLPVARHGYHGIFIELKTGDNKPSEQQNEWMRKLRAQGYKCEVVWDQVVRAINLLEWYLEG